MKYLVLTLALLVGLSSSIHAQEKKAEKAKKGLFSMKKDQTSEKEDEQVIKFGGSSKKKETSTAKSKKKEKTKKAKKEKSKWYLPPKNKVLGLEELIEQDLQDASGIGSEKQNETTVEDYQLQDSPENSEEVKESTPEKPTIDLTQEITEGRRAVDPLQKYFIAKQERAEFTNYAYLTHKTVDSSNYAIILPKVNSEEEFLTKRWEKAFKLYQHKYFNHALQLLLDLEIDLRSKESVGNNAIVKYYIGLCYMFGTDNVSKSIEYLHSAALTTDLDFNISKGIKNIAAPVEAIMYFSMAHLKCGNLIKAERYIDLYLSLGDRNEKVNDIALALRGQIKYAQKHTVNNTSFVVNPLSSLNTVYQEFFARYTPDGQAIYFLSTRPSGSGGYAEERADFPNGTFYEKIWSVDNNSTAFSEPILALRTLYKEGFGGFYNNGKSIAYSLRDDLSNGVYTSDFGFDEWQAPNVLVSVENNMVEGSYFTIHPSGNLIVYEHKQPNKDRNDLTKDLYFISRDSLGQKWTSPKALPKKVNSSYNEKFPVFSADGSTLYFSSDNDSTYGGYDIFKVELSAFPNTYGDVQNMGLPFNSHEDDISFAPNPLISGGIVARKTATSAGGFDLFLIQRGIKENTLPQVREAEVVRPKRMLLIKNNVSGKSLVLKDSNAEQVIFNARPCDTLSLTYYENNKPIKTETVNTPCKANSESFVKASLSNYPSVLLKNY